jgi:hypothetical protein
MADLSKLYTALDLVPVDLQTAGISTLPPLALSLSEILGNVFLFIDGETTAPAAGANLKTITIPKTSLYDIWGLVGLTGVTTGRRILQLSINDESAARVFEFGTTLFQAAGATSFNPYAFPPLRVMLPINYTVNIRNEVAFAAGEVVYASLAIIRRLA